jgi:hypothetical protein
MAYGRYWEFDAVTNAVLVPGILLKDVPRFK